MVLKSSTHGKETAEKIPTFVINVNVLFAFTILPPFQKPKSCREKVKRQ